MRLPPIFGGTRHSGGKIMRNLFKKRHLASSLSCVLCAVMLSSALTVPSSAATAVGNISDVKKKTVEEIELSDGTKTGVVWSQLQIDGDTYGTERVLNMAEIDLSNTHLSMEVINSGNYIVSKTTVAAAAEKYTKEHDGQTVLAAVNGDLWLTSSTHGNSTTKMLNVSQGVCIIDGEIWASQQTAEENIEASGVVQGTTPVNLSCFGVTSRNQPLIGSPDIQVKMKANGREISITGINRLPATNAVMVYNDRVNSSNYALNDAYEVELEAVDTAFRAGGTITAVVKAIYPAGSETRPAIGKNTILITARGNRINIIKKNLAVGDTVTFETTLTDRMGNTELWQDVKEAIGGHLLTLRDGRVETFRDLTDNYPTTLIGYKDDGTVAILTFTSAKSGTRASLRFCDNLRLCYEMGYNTVFYLDGGGSSTFVTLDEGSYTVRNACSDGTPRSVMNGIAVVWNDEKVCNRQGSLSHIKKAAPLSGIPATYLDGALLADIMIEGNAVSLSYASSSEALKITTNADTNDPYAWLDLAGLQTISADDYKYVVIKARTNHSAKTTDLALYYTTGASKGTSESRCKTVSVKSGLGEWQYIVADMSGENSWKGDVRRIRFDLFNSASTSKNTSMYVDSIVFCKTAEEAANVKNGWTPEGAVVDYLKYKEDALRPATQVGDINGDGDIDLKDVTVLLKYLAEWEDVTIDESVADVTADGTVDVKDVTHLLKYAADWDDIILGAS